MQLLPSVNLTLLAGLGLGLLLTAAVASWVDPYPQARKKIMPTIPEQIQQSAAELQASYDDALAKSQAAQQAEAAAVQARQAAEEAKATGRQANETLKAKTAAHLSLLSSFYQPPQVPPAV